MIIDMSIALNVFGCSVDSSFDLFDLSELIFSSIFIALDFDPINDDTVE